MTIRLCLFFVQHNLYISLSLHFMQTSMLSTSNYQVVRPFFLFHGPCHVRTSELTHTHTDKLMQVRRRMQSQTQQQAAPLQESTRSHCTSEPRLNDTETPPQRRRVGSQRRPAHTQSNYSILLGVGGYRIIDEFWRQFRAFHIFAANNFLFIVIVFIFCEFVSFRVHLWCAFRALIAFS